jgi:hypothetical protein
MGEVYKARDTRLDRTVAIKVSREKFSERFEQEARGGGVANIRTSANYTTWGRVTSYGPETQIPLPFSADFRDCRPWSPAISSALKGAATPARSAGERISDRKMRGLNSPHQYNSDVVRVAPRNPVWRKSFRLTISCTLRSLSLRVRAQAARLAARKKQTDHPPTSSQARRKRPGPIPTT